MHRATTTIRHIARREMLAAAAAALATAKDTAWKIGIAQISLSDRLEENQKKIVAYIRKAAAEQCRVVVFPEGSLCAEPAAEAPEIKRSLAEIRAAATAAKIYVLLGGKSIALGEKVSRNWMVAVEPAGKQILRYDKLYDNPRARAPGVFSMDGWGCSAIICADRWLRAIEDLPVFDGARVTFELSNNYDSEWVPELGWYWYVPRAIRNGAYVVLANTCGGGKHGHSAVIAPDGSMVAASENEERLLAVTIDPAQASRKESLRRVDHPILNKFWEAGKGALQSGAPPPEKFEPLVAPEVDVRLSIAQMSCNSGVEANVARMAKLIAEAARGGADVVGFPELAVTGSSESEVKGADARTLAQALRRIQQAARESHVCVVFGMPHIEKNRLTNAAFVLGPDGSLLTRCDQLAVNRPKLFQPGEQASTMWFRVKGVPAVVTIGHDGLWSEIAELTALAGAHLHVHITNEAGSGRDQSLRRMQIWANLASWGTFTATVNAASPAGGGSAIWEDLHRKDETALAKVDRAPEGHEKMAVYSPFSANCLSRAGENERILSAVERMNLKTLHHSMSKNPQMAAWYTLGAQILGPPRNW